ncbi:hypothetical protein EB796_024966 [Bugula neritina]|uniref:Uncharacterized protein n=1 Tax=Bugula neritina TaxID=10212 RepID=A0A7J7ITJ5_BUGNE|nr:hypothetical protein EB796_024966 [Bugula neritina]
MMGSQKIIFYINPTKINLRLLCNEKKKYPGEIIPTYACLATGASAMEVEDFISRSYIQRVTLTRRKKPCQQS